MSDQSLDMAKTKLDVWKQAQSEYEAAQLAYQQEDSTAVATSIDTCLSRICKEVSRAKEAIQRAIDSGAYNSDSVAALTQLKADLTAWDASKPEFPCEAGE